ncbi:MAG: ABC transporter ATP-binding protein, partial [Verrucomicrobiota bacterium]
VVQAFSREEKNLEMFNELNMINRDTEIRIAKLDAIFMPSMDFLGILNTTIVVSFGAWLLNSKYASAYAGSLTTANLAAYVLYSNAILWPLRMIVELYSMSLRAMAAAERVYEIIDMQPGVPNPDNPAPAGNLHGDIAMQNVDFRYGPSQPWILKNFNLEIPAGQTLALVGETGAGKTTISSLIARFYDVTGGETLIDNRNIREYNQEELHRNMAIVPQEGFLFSGTVLDNLRFRRPEMPREKVIAAAKELGVHEAISKLSHGYDTEVREGGASVSEGQRQLISITRALIADPSILILDEPTSSLDVHTESILQSALDHLVKDRTTILIAHRLSTVKKGDRIIVLDQGRIIESGTHDKLMRMNGRYATLARQSSAHGTFDEPTDTTAS